MQHEELEALADVWRSIRASAFAHVVVDDLEKDDARSVMNLFEPEERARVAKTLNDVRLWALAQPKEPLVDLSGPSSGRETAPPEPVKSGDAESGQSGASSFASAVAGGPTAPTVVLGGTNPSTSPTLEPVGSSGEVSPASAAGPTSGTVRVIDGPGVPATSQAKSLEHGPVEGWTPAAAASVTRAQQEEIPTALLIAVGVTALLAIILWILVLVG